jgi:hypothetical protein
MSKIPGVKLNININSSIKNLYLKLIWILQIQGGDPTGSGFGGQSCWGKV